MQKLCIDVVRSARGLRGDAHSVAALVFLQLLVAFFLFSGCSSSQLLLVSRDEVSFDLSELTLEELMELEFTTVFKTPGNVWDTPAAVHVLDNENLKRSWGLTIPDALRNIPGMQVAQHNAHSWSVTSRGFDGLARGVAGQFANKFLVLQDGRSLYNPLFSGVSWDAQDVMLEDLERIEVIRGPGASVWGANAVNSVINLLSKDAADTQGGLLTTGIGTDYQQFSHARFGGRLGRKTFYRVFHKYLKSDNLPAVDGTEGQDGWHTHRAGFRMDVHDRRSSLSLNGQLYTSQLGEIYPGALSPTPPIQSRIDHQDEMSGGHLLAQWKYPRSSSSELSLQAYFDRASLQTPIVQGATNTYDFEFNHRVKAGRTHQVVYGAGYRLYQDRFNPTFQFQLAPGTRNHGILSAFIQDEIALWPNHLTAMVGTKVEQNSFSGFEIQPSLRLTWKPVSRQVLWLAVSRAVRTPSRSEMDGNFFLDPISPSDAKKPVFLKFEGNKAFKSEKLVALEAGARRRIAPGITFDFDVFYHDYRDIRGDARLFGFPQPLPDSASFITLTAINGLAGKTYGIEALGRFQPSSRWELFISYNLFESKFPALAPDQFSAQDGRNPKHQLVISSYFEPFSWLETDLRFRYVDEIPARNIPGYPSFDLRLAWHVMPKLDLVLTGRNLLQSQHIESTLVFGEDDTTPATLTLPGKIERSMYAKLAWRF